MRVRVVGVCVCVCVCVCVREERLRKESGEGWAYQPVNGADTRHDDGDEGLHEKLRLRDATNGHSFCCLGRAVCSAHGCGEGGGWVGGGWNDEQGFG